MDRHAPPVLVVAEPAFPIRATGAGGRARPRALTLIGVSSAQTEPLERGLPSFAAPEPDELSETFLGLGNTLGTDTRRVNTTAVLWASGETEDVDLESRITLTMPFSDDAVEVVFPEEEPQSRVVRRGLEVAPSAVRARPTLETLGDVLESAMSL